MTKYGRTYSPPIFHITHADSDQIELMETVFRTLADSGISFVEVRMSDTDKNLIDIITHGPFSKKEQKEILSEIQEIYDTE